MFRLLNAAGCGDKNIEALTSVMDLQSVHVKCSLLEIDAWKNICVKSDVIKTLHFRWDPHCDSLKEESVLLFFRDLLDKNQSIKEIKLEFFHGEVKQIKDATMTKGLLEEVSYFGQYISQCIRKKGLQSLSVYIQLIEPPEQIKEQFQECVIDKLVHVFNACSGTLSLEELKLDVDLGTNQLEKLIKAIRPVRSLKKLSLFRISSEIGGFQALSELILQGRILELELSLLL